MKPEELAAIRRRVERAMAVQAEYRAEKRGGIETCALVEANDAAALLAEVDRCSKFDLYKQRYSAYLHIGGHPDECPDCKDGVCLLGKRERR